MHRSSRALAAQVCGVLLVLGGATLLRPAAAETVVLTDGTRLVGSVKKASGGYDLTDGNGKTTFIPDARIARIELGGKAGSSSTRPAQPAPPTPPTTLPATLPATRPADPAGEGVRDPALESLRRSVENLDDLGAIVARYERFIRQQTGNPPVADAARADLTRWQQRREQGLIKHRGQWVTPYERDEQLRRTFERAAAARLLIKEGRIDEARAALAEMLSANPENPSALYLLAVLDYRAGEHGRAKAGLERVRERLPDHVPTLVNLAVVNVRQNRHPRALRFLEDAMRLAPGNREVLDNVAEALVMLPANIADDRATAQARELFGVQDAALRAEMERRGLYRWGSAWVERAQFEELQALEREIEAAVTQLKRQYADLEADIVAIDRKVEENVRFLERTRSNSTRIDTEGRIIQLPLPPVYFEVEREQQQLAAERIDKQQQMARLEQDAQQQRQRYPTPPYKGELAFIGEDGVPVVMPAEPAPATQPATQPATRSGDVMTTRPSDDEAQ